MTAKLVTRYYGSGYPRTDLCKAIPLDTPFHMFIDPSAACNHSCRMCFNADKSRTHHEVMKMETFGKIVKDLWGFPQKLKTIKLYAFGEPLMNNQFPEMVRLIKDSGVSDRVETTTNGWWLAPDRSDAIIKAGLDRIVISVNGLSDMSYLYNTGAKVDFKQYVENVRYFYEHSRGKCIVHVKTADAVSDCGNQIFYKIFRDIADEVAVETMVPIWHNVPSDVKPYCNIYNNPITPVEVCPYIFYHMTVHANGQVSTCFMDWERRNIIGDARKESLVDIWNGEKLKQLRQDHLQFRRSKHEICKDCGQLVYGQADNIDGCANKICRRMYP